MSYARIAIKDREQCFRSAIKDERDVKTVQTTEKKTVIGVIRVVCVIRGRARRLSSVFIGVHLWIVAYIVFMSSDQCLGVSRHSDYAEDSE